LGENLIMDVVAEVVLVLMLSKTGFATAYSVLCSKRRDTHADRPAQMTMKITWIPTFV
jgi:hypothetical protein